MDIHGFTCTDDELKSLGATCNSPSVSQFSSASNADDDEEYQYYRDRVLAYTGITPPVTTLQTCLARVALDSQFSSASDAEDDEAEYQYYRHRAFWVVHLGLIQSKISQVLEGRVWVSPSSLLLVLVAASMLPLPLYQRQSGSARKLI